MKLVVPCSLDNAQERVVSNMDERIVNLVKTFIPDAEVLKLYKDAAGEILVDIVVGGSEMTCALKKNHAGELYLD